jgi:myo-inositol-1(or 4)-monophosphatase
MAVRSALYHVMSAAALKAARGLKRDFGEVEQLQVSVKGPGDFVSTADLKAERILREELAKARPQFGFLMEESGETKGRDGRHRWIVDPLDGTTNFLHGIPHWAISIGLEQDGELVAGLVYAPIADEMFFAEKGGGAYLNDRRLRVSARRKLDESLIGTGIPFAGHGDHERYLRTLRAAIGITTGVRRMGVASLDLAYVAAGRFDGFWEYGLKSWDMAAGLVLVREAGGTIGGLTDGSPIDTGDILAANQAIYEPLRQLLKGAMGAAG